MSKYNSCRDLAFKMDSEGGLDGMIFGYGLKCEDLPDDMPAEMHSRIDLLFSIREAYDDVQSFLYERMEDDPKPGDWDYEDTTKEEDRCEPW